MLHHIVVNKNIISYIYYITLYYIIILYSIVANYDII